MTSDTTKLTLSIAGIFLGAVTLAYGVLPDKNAITLPVVVALVMAGLTAVSGYLTGYIQKNPRNNKTAEDLLDSIKGSALPLAVQAQVAPALATEAAKPSGAPMTVPGSTALPGAGSIAWSSLESRDVQGAAQARAAAHAADADLFADCLLVSRFRVAETLDAFRRLPPAEQAAWRLYAAEVVRRESTSA